MNGLVYHVVSGQIFFTGIILLIIAVLATIRSTPLTRRIAVFAFLLGVIGIAISSTAIPYYWYVVAVVVTLAWLISRSLKKYRGQKWCRWFPSLVIVVWVVAAGFEVPYHITPTLTAASSQSITVIGDSITAGIGGNDHSEKWPDILARRERISVQNISRMGETTASALKQIEKQPIRSDIVILEIGGNDLLGVGSSAQFSKNLDALLREVCSADRQVVMFELPLPPFCHEYGRIQRELARQYHVLLIPKRVLLSVLAADNSTLDSIHLSQAGHQKMADAVWQIIKSAFSTQ